MRKAIATAVVLVAMLVTPTLQAQVEKTPLETTVKLVNDRRSTTFFARLTVLVELPGISEAELSAVRMVINKAVDDKGTVLYEPREEEPEFVPVQRRMNPDPSNRAVLDIALQSPSRDAMTVKEIRGEIDLYMPSRDPNAVVSIKNVKSKAGKSLPDKTLKSSGVSITVVDAERREADKEKAVEAHRAELKEQGYEEEDMRWMLEDFADSYYVPKETELALIVDDPDGRVQQLELIDAKGEPIRGYAMYHDDVTSLSTFEPLGDDVGLRVNLRTPKTISSHTFTLKDVKLP